jgi:zinc D-Ala-D-Ala dipeptidase
MDQLVDLRSVIPGLIFDIRYATSDNFTGTVLYESDACLLLEPTARKLLCVQEALKSRGLGLKVFDAFRPISVQRRLWEVFPDDRYVANPANGSRHNRGTAVDVTLVDRLGNELPMPTLFDDFSERAHRSFDNLPPDILANRRLLEEAMEAAGFVGLPTEWWHFDDADWECYPIL